MSYLKKYFSFKTLLIAIFIALPLFVITTIIFDGRLQLAAKISHNSTFTATNHNCWKKIEKQFYDYIKCLIDKSVRSAQHDVYDRYGSMLGECFRSVNYNKSTKSFIQLTPFAAGDEEKMAVVHDRLSERDQNNRCTVVTIGIGQSILAEINIKKRLDWYDIRSECLKTKPF